MYGFVHMYDVSESFNRLVVCLVLALLRSAKV